MLRVTFGLVAVVVLLSAVGCSMCCHPYDNCGPVQGNACQSCCSQERAGSILSGSGAVTSDLTPIEEVSRNTKTQGKKTVTRPQTTKKTAKTNVGTGDVQRVIKTGVRPGDVPGSERIVSVTDRVVDASGSAVAKTEDSSTQAVARATDSSASAGWMARRPTMEVQR